MVEREGGVSRVGYFVPDVNGFFVFHVLHRSLERPQRALVYVRLVDGRKSQVNYNFFHPSDKKTRTVTPTGINMLLISLEPLTFDQRI
jgi:hypothetical protein